MADDYLFCVPCNTRFANWDYFQRHCKRQCHLDAVALAVAGDLGKKRTLDDREEDDRGGSGSPQAGDSGSSSSNNNSNGNSNGNSSTLHSSSQSSHEGSLLLSVSPQADDGDRAYERLGEGDGLAGSFADNGVLFSILYQLKLHICSCRHRVRA